MCWNLPIEEVEELARENKLNTMTCPDHSLGFGIQPQIVHSV